MLAKKFITILILTFILFAWTGDQIWAAFSSKECQRCCTVNCQCSRPLRKSCEKNAQVKKSSCDPLYKPSEKVQATLPGSVKDEYKGYRESQTAKFALIPPSVKLTLASFSYYLDYMRDTQSPLIYTECFQDRAPPAYIHS